jgi:hypothetical protein
MSWTTPILLQISHRLGAIALLATLGAWAMLFLEKDASIPLATVATATDVGLCSALVARLLSPSTSPDRREANGAAIFNLVLLVLAVHLMVFTRVDVIRSAAADFFAPQGQVEIGHAEQP